MDTTTLRIDNSTFTIVIYILGFILTSLVGIITWMAQGLMKKVDAIKSIQEQDTVQRTEMKGDINRLAADTNIIKQSISEIPKINEKLIQFQGELHTVKSLTSEYRRVTEQYLVEMRQMEKELFHIKKLNSNL